MKRFSLALLLMALMANALASPSVVIETRLQPQGDVRVGQPLQLEIDLLTDTWLTATPDFSALQVADTLVTFEGSQGRNTQRNIKGRRYFGVTYSYQLIPLTPGVISLPAFALEVAVGQAEQPLSVSVPGRSFAVQPLPPAAAENAAILAGNLVLSQQLLPGVQPLSAGQPVIREVRVQAQRALALSIPPPQAVTQSLLSGSWLPVAITPLSDGRGQVTGGERIDRIRYLPQAAGSYVLPELVLNWWDIEQNKLQTARLPALQIDVVAADLGPADALLAAGRKLLRRLSAYPGDWPGALLTLALLAGLLQRYYRRALRLSVQALHGLQHLWLNSSLGLRRSAIAQIKARPASLTGLYLLIARQGNSRTLRHSQLNPQSKAELLQSTSAFYCATPEPKASEANLISAIRRLGRQRTKPTRCSALVPLHKYRQ